MPVRLLAILLMLIAWPAFATDIALEDLDIATARVPTWYPATTAEAGYVTAQGWTQYDATCFCEDAGCATPEDHAGSGCTPAAGTSAFPFLSDACFTSPGPANPDDETGAATTDWSSINCMLSNAADNSVIYLPNSGDATYDMGDTQSNREIIRIEDSNRVLRCESTAVRLEMTTGDTTGYADCSNAGLSGGIVCRANIVSIGGSATGTPSDWTSGYTVGTSAIGVTSGAGFDANEWALVRIADTGWVAEETPTTNCPNHLDYVGRGSTSSDYALMGLHKIDTVVSNTVNIERGLRIDYSLSGTACSNEGIVYPFTPTENVGLEDCTLISDSSISASNIGGEPHIGIGGVVNSWVVGNVVERAEDVILQSQFSSRNWIQGNTFRNWGDDDSEASTEGIRIFRGSNDDVFENNYMVDFSVGWYIHHGPHGTVYAYNYMRGGTGGPNSMAERGMFWHGLYPANILGEGNDMDMSISWDKRWGIHGPRSGLFRNRVVDPGSPTSAERNSSIGTNRDGGGPNTPLIDELFVIGNTTAYFYTSYCGVTCNTLAKDDDMHAEWDFDRYMNGGDMWVEKNMFRTIKNCLGDATPQRCGFHQDTPEDDTWCGVDGGGSALECYKDGGGGLGDPGDNYGGDVAPAAMLGKAIPHSLYRGDTAPSWWCQESCDWTDVYNGIGAWGDDFGAPSLCKLPAEILAEGGTCTAVGAGPPYSPVLITTTVPFATITNTGATIGATISDNGGGTIGEYGTVWGTLPNPTGNENVVGTDNPIIEKVFTDVRTLSAASFIWARGYATSGVGTSYSENRIFHTEPNQATGTPAFTNVTANAATISWTLPGSGAGAGTIVVLRANADAAVAPTDGTVYTESAAFGSGDNLGTSNYVVYAGTGTTVDVTNLVQSTTYAVAIYTYAGTAVNFINYQQDSPAANTETTTGGEVTSPPVNCGN